MKYKNVQNLTQDFYNEAMCKVETLSKGDFYITSQTYLEARQVNTHFFKHFLLLAQYNFDIHADLVNLLTKLVS